jgi:hypothetical protein
MSSSSVLVSVRLVVCSSDTAAMALWSKKNMQSAIDINININIDLDIVLHEHDWLTYVNLYMLCCSGRKGTGCPRDCFPPR